MANQKNMLEKLFVTNKEDTMTKDIYVGDLIKVWEDDGDIYVNFKSNRVALLVTTEEWEAIKNEFKLMIINGIKDRINNET